MDIKNLQTELIKHGESKKSAEVYFREDWQCYYFSLLGKCFGRMDDELLTLKGDVEENDILRQRYKDIIPGYYANKAHWNSIYLNTLELTIEELKTFIDISYDLVFKKLTKKEKASVENL